MVEQIYLAKPRGFCAGVVMAIEAVEKAARELREEGELVVYHAIVHNEVVVRRLQEQHRVHFVEDLSEVEALREELAKAGRKLNETVVFSAHGIPPGCAPRRLGATCTRLMRPAPWSPKSTARPSATPGRATGFC